MTNLLDDRVDDHGDGPRTAAPQTTTASAARVRTRASAAAPTVVGLLGLAISLAGIGTPSIWYDEAATITSATRSWGQLWQMIGSVDAVHALYYAGMHLVFDVFGYSPLSLRVPSAVAIGAAAALTVVLGRQLGRPRFAVLAGLVFVLLPRTTWAGTEGRSYALTALFAVLLTVVLVNAVGKGRRDDATSRRWWALYCGLAVISVALFLYLALILVAHAVTMIVWLVATRGAAWATVRRWVASAAAAAVVVLPLVLLVVGQGGQLHWIKPLGDETGDQVLRQQWFDTGGAFAVVGWTLVVGGSAVLIRAAARRRATTMPAEHVSPAAIALPALIIPTLALLATSALYLPIYTPRYLTMCLPFVALVAAAAVDHIRPRAGVAAVLAVLVALAIPQAVAQRQPEAKERTSWAKVADLIAEARAADGPGATTAIIYGGVQYHPIATARVIAYSYPDAFAGTVDVTLRTPAAETGQLWETENPLRDSLERVRDADAVYLVTSFSRDVRPATSAILRTDGWRVAEAWDRGDVHILKYERR